MITKPNRENYSNDSFGELCYQRDLEIMQELINIHNNLTKIK